MKLNIVERLFSLYSMLIKRFTEIDPEIYFLWPGFREALAHQDTCTSNFVSKVLVLNASYGIARRLEIPKIVGPHIDDYLKYEFDRLFPISYEDVKLAYTPPVYRKESRSYSTTVVLLKKAVFDRVMQELEDKKGVFTRLDYFAFGCEVPVGVNFLPENVKNKKHIWWNGAQLWLASLLSISIFAVSELSLSQEKSYTDSLDVALAELKLKLKDARVNYSELQDELATNAMLNNVRTLSNKKIFALESLTKCLSSASWIESFVSNEIGETSVLIQAENAASQLVALKECEPLKDATLSGPMQFDQLTRKERFKVIAHLE